LAIAALVLTFPTDKRLAKWQQRQKSSHWGYFRNYPAYSLCLFSHTRPPKRVSPS
jgi:hypothetical protein